MNKHDERRIQSLTKTLRKAKEQAEAAGLYLSVGEEDIDILEHVGVALEHIELALANVSKGDDGRACKVCGRILHHPCPDGCYWVEADLCSSCAEKAGVSDA